MSWVRGLGAAAACASRPAQHSPHISPERAISAYARHASLRSLWEPLDSGRGPSAPSNKPMKLPAASLGHAGDLARHGRGSITRGRSRAPYPLGDK